MVIHPKPEGGSNDLPKDCCLSDRLSPDGREPRLKGTRQYARILGHWVDDALEISEQTEI